MQARVYIYWPTFIWWICLDFGFKCRGHSTAYLLYARWNLWF